MDGKVLRDKGAYLLLGVLVLFCCCFICGKSCIFASKVDWISQHSVIPDYFRQQFYDSGQFFPEFAANIGGGQNIYNFAYYGLYSPAVLFSYFLPFVEMGDYLIAVSVLSLMAAVLLFYHWLLRRGISGDISFLTALVFLLAAPMIYHSYNQIMFVNYMPFLCLGLIAVDRFLEKGKAGLYIVSVFLMIMTSFYYSIGGMLVLVLYGIFRYLQIEEIRGRQVTLSRFLGDGLRFLLPMFTAVLLSAVLLVPTAMALMGGRNTKQHMNIMELLIPKAQVFLYTPYGIGLTTLVMTVLLSGLAYRKYYERFLHLSCMIILSVPLFSYLLNGGLYARDKAMIPFLPLICYLLAYYMEKQRRKEIPFLKGCIPFLLTLLLLYLERKQGMFSQYQKLILVDGIIMLLCFLLASYRKCNKCYLLLLLAPISFLCFYGVVLNETSDKMMEREYYEEITHPDLKRAVQEITEKEKGFYRIEQGGTDAENGVNFNRIWDMDQYISSLYSSAYHAEYQKFRTETFQLEQPFRNVLMQSVSSNPIYQKLMGVKYIISREEIPGYQKYKTEGDVTVYQREDVLPVAYATDRVIDRESYETMEFPYNQTLLSAYAVAGQGESMRDTDVPEKTGWDIEPVLPEIPEYAGEEGIIEKSGEGYHIQLQKTKTVSIEMPDLPESDAVFVQFRIQNHRKSKDVSVWVEGIKNKLTADTHIYYNHNTTFHYAITPGDNDKTLELGFGAGDYDCSAIRFYLGKMEEGTENLCQSEFHVNAKETKGNQIAGSIDAKKDGYLITSIPYDSHFEVLLDGKKAAYEKVNTAFLGMKITAGEHHIEFIYHAPGLLSGKCLSVLGGILFLVILQRKRSVDVMNI